jgi:rRNA maturation RNase YbeY
VPAGISPATIRGWVRQARHKLPRRFGSVSVVIVGPAAMQKINWQWRRKKGPTNVLSFSFTSGTARPNVDEDVWGEIILCPSVIRREAKIQQRNYRQFFKFLFEHGLIHLYGLDHQTRRQQKVWETYEQRLQL